MVLVSPYVFRRCDTILSITGVERWDVALITLPELITLVFGIFRRRPVVFVWVVGVHDESFTISRKYDYMTVGSLSTRRWEERLLGREHAARYLSLLRLMLIPSYHHQSG